MLRAMAVRLHRGLFMFKPSGLAPQDEASNARIWGA